MSFSMSLITNTEETDELSQRRHILAPSLPYAYSWNICMETYVSNTLMTEKQDRASESGTTFGMYETNAFSNHPGCPMQFLV